MAYNTEYVLKRGEEGTVMNFTLRDENGPVNLTGWTVTVTAQLGDEDPAIEGASCTLAANQSTTGKGKASHTFTNETADIPAGVYRLEFKGVSAGGAVYYFPKAKGATYATLIVQEPLA